MTQDPEADTRNLPAVDMTSVEEFLAHAYALETEAAERYEEMADSMEVHHNYEVAKLFRTLCGAGRKHAEQMLERAEGRELPRIAPWDLKWSGSEGPETPPMEAIHYLMTPYQALDMARRIERHARDFYAAVAEQCPLEDVCAMAAEFAEEEAEHVELLNRWIADYPKPAPDWDYDPDPPVMPE